MELIQGVFEEYDTMIFQSRSWSGTAWMAAPSMAWARIAYGGFDAAKAGGFLRVFLWLRFD
jgi:hypothetical protein